MSVEMFKPRSDEYAGDAVIILGNHSGSVVSEDTGRDAQYLADYFELPVIGFDRPGTNCLPGDKQLALRLGTADGYVAEMLQVGAEVDRYVDLLGAREAIAVGRSAAGLGALALAKSESVSNLKFVSVTEPIACRAFTLNEGTRIYNAYRASQKEIQAETEADRLVSPDFPGLSVIKSVKRLIRMAIDGPVDKSYNKKIWASDAAVKYAAYIAEHMPDIDVAIEFAQYSLVAPPDTLHGVMEPIAELRTKGAPFVVRRSLRTTHASYDKRDYAARRLAPDINRLLLAAAV